MSLKDNFNQAVKEILKKDGLVGDDLSKGSKKKTEIDKFMGETPVPGNISERLTPGSVPENQPPAASAAEQGYATSYSEKLAAPSAEDFRQSVHKQSADPFAEEMGGRADEYASSPFSDNSDQTGRNLEYQPRTDEPRASGQTVSSYGGGGGYNPPPRNPLAGASVFRGGRPPETPYYETEETTVISRNTRISGDISSFANVTVEGSVQGDVKLTKNISVSGKIVGNIECNNAVMAGAQMQGSIASKGQVQIDHDTVLLGNIDTQYLDLNGRIKGNVDVGGKAEFKNDAVIVGDITASTISVIDGAVIKGYVNTTFMQESTSNVFPEAITVEA